MKADRCNPGFRGQTQRSEDHCVHGKSYLGGPIPSILPGSVLPFKLRWQVACGGEIRTVWTFWAVPRWDVAWSLELRMQWISMTLPGGLCRGRTEDVQAQELLPGVSDCIYDICNEIFAYAMWNSEWGQCSEKAVECDELESYFLLCLMARYFSRLEVLSSNTSSRAVVTFLIEICRLSAWLRNICLLALFHISPILTPAQQLSLWPKTQH